MRFSPGCGCCVSNPTCAFGCAAPFSPEIRPVYFTWENVTCACYGTARQATYGTSADCIMYTYRNVSTCNEFVVGDAARNLYTQIQCGFGGVINCTIRVETDGGTLLGNYRSTTIDPSSTTSPLDLLFTNFTHFSGSTSAPDDCSSFDPALLNVRVTE